MCHEWHRGHLYGFIQSPMMRARALAFLLDGNLVFVAHAFVISWGSTVCRSCCRCSFTASPQLCPTQFEESVSALPGGGRIAQALRLDRVSNTPHLPTFRRRHLG